MNILQIEIFGRGGLTHHAFHLGRALAARGMSVRLATAAEYELDEPRFETTDGGAVDRVFGRLTRRPNPGPGWRRLLRGLEIRGSWETIAECTEDLYPRVLERGNR